MCEYNGELKSVFPNIDEMSVTSIPDDCKIILYTEVNVELGSEITSNLG